MRTIIVASLLAGAALPLSPAAHAQTGASEDAAGGDIIVTARRREERLQDVPISIAAIGQDTMQQAQIATETDLQRAVPGLTIRQNGSANQFNYSIRGQSVDTYTNSPPGVLTYIYEAQVVTRYAGTFYDLSGIQVLKGPQGTLFGRNATGGAVLFDTAKPKDHYEGYMVARYGNHDLFHTEGAVSIPLTPEVRLRVAGFYEHGGAFVENVRNGEKLGKQDLGSVRGTLVIAPGNLFRNTTVVQYTKEGGNNVPTEIYSAYKCGATFNGAALNTTADCFYGPANPGFAFLTAAHPNIFAGGVDAAADRQRAWGPWKTETGVPLYHKANGVYVINTTEVPLGGETKLKNIFMLNRSSADDGYSYDGTPYLIFQIFGTPNANLTTLTDPLGFIQKTSQVTDELQIQGKTADGRLTYVAGAYYLKQEDENDSWLLAFDFSPLAAGSQLRYHAQTTAESKALFAQATYGLTDALHLTGGVRYTWEKATSKQLAGSLFGTGQPLEVFKDSKPSWTVSLDYKLSPNFLVYASHRGSWRAGSYNYSVPPIDVTADKGGNRFNSETTKDVEIGMKYSGDALGVPVTVNAAGYIQWVDNIQRAAYVPEPGGTPSLVTTNVPKARIQGIELSVDIKPSRGFEFGFAMAHTDAKYTDNKVVLPNSVGVFSPTFYGPYADSPRWTGSAYVQVNHELGGNAGELTFRADVSAQSKFFFSNVAATLSPESDIAGYALVNARASWKNIGGSGLTAAIFARNLLNKQYYGGGNSLGATLGLNTSVPGKPRFWGGELRFDF